jgi:uncharacterized membrane protein YjgN (DUF898 family)
MANVTIDRGGASPAGVGQGFVYDGRLSEIYVIFIKNLLLAIVTLGFYRFWGKTNLRRYIWSHVSLQGDRFEYTGTGGELFKGFLIVFGFFFVAGIVKAAIELGGGPGSPQATLSNLVFGLLIFYLIFVAHYSAQRYRLTRTSWRGVRGGMTGSAWLWGIKAMFLTVVAGLTLWLAGPWVQMRLIDDRLNNSYFGDAKAAIHSSSKPLYLAFVLGILVFVVGTAAVIAAIWGVLAANGTIAEVSAILSSAADPETRQAQIEDIVAHNIWVIVLAYLAMVILSLIAFAQYYVATAREIAGKLTMSELHFGTTITVGRYINRMFWNIVIIIITAGLGLPVALHRTIRFLERNIQIYGQIDGSKITQSNLPRPKFGEGLLEAFDPGII